jgi:hypothetical protein
MSTVLALKDDGRKDPFFQIECNSEYICDSLLVSYPISARKEA